MRKIILFFSFFAIAISPVCGQLRWQSAESYNKQLPASIRLYETRDSLNKRPFRAFYMKVNLNDPGLYATVCTGNGNRYTPQQYVENTRGTVYAVFNTTFFSFKDNSNLNVVIHKGKLRAINPKMLPFKNSHGERDTAYPATGAFGMDRHGKADVAWVYHAGRKDQPYAYPQPSLSIVHGKDTQYIRPDRRSAAGGKRWRMREAVGGGPVLVQAGKVFVSSREEWKFNRQERMLHPRTVIGYTTGNEMIVLAVEGRHKGVADGADLYQLAEIMISLGCVEALNLDGGGSSCLYVGGRNTILPADSAGQRPVPAVLMIRAR